MYNSEIGEEHLIGITFVDFQEPNQNNLATYLQGLEDRNAPVVE